METDCLDTDCPNAFQKCIKANIVKALTPFFSLSKGFAFIIKQMCNVNVKRMP